VVGVGVTAAHSGAELHDNHALTINIYGEMQFHTNRLVWTSIDHPQLSWSVLSGLKLNN